MPYPTSACRYCHAQVIWARTHRAKAMPVDPAEDPDGNVLLTTAADGVPLASVLGPGDQLFAPEGTRHTPHFATCPSYPGTKPRATR